jgi:dihydroorotate dehydrogenase electron transfer subunit
MPGAGYNFRRMLFDVAARVLANTPLSPDYNVIALAAPEIAESTAPGQFVMVKPQQGLDPLLRRPFSVFEVLRDQGGNITGISLLNKRVGVGTGLLYYAERGDTVQVLGPLGRPFVPVDPPAEAWMVAGGVGLAPFATLAETLAKRGTPMRLFYGARSAADLYYADFFSRLGASLHLTTEDGSRGERGRITAPLARELAGSSAAATVYACGPTPMMRVVAELGEKAGRPVFVSLEQVMGCGMGGCYSCVVRVRRGDSSHFVRSCLDGPVFDSRAIVWDALGEGH